MFNFFCKKKNKKKEENNYLKELLAYEFELYQRGVRYNYAKNLLDNWKLKLF